MKTINERRLEILEWEKNNRNLNNRSVDGGICKYSGPIGCAVGRLIDDKELCEKLDNSKDGSTGVRRVFYQLPDSVKELGEDFLARLQYLHDNIVYWDDAGLNDSGILAFDTIKEYFKL
jgi:hypothetical protein